MKRSDFAPPDILMTGPTGNGDHPPIIERAGPPTFECERCGNRFHDLLTDGRCTTCNHRHGRTNRSGGTGGRLVELTSTPLGFGLMLFVLASVQLVLFVLAATRA